MAGKPISELRFPSVGQAAQAHPYFGIDNVPGKLPCTVVSVNRRHGYFTVQFPSGYREAYRVDAKEVSF